MDTACLRIKFTPLLQKNQKNSKCCLEIVPEVSCIQNLDKLTWRQETNFIEYTIPMTYKVILKKRQAIDNVSENVVKTYHSCVDLLLTSSKSTNLGSGDVSKIISDTFIFTKSLLNEPNQENFINTLTDSRKLPSMARSYPISHKTTNTSKCSGNLTIKTKENIKNGQESVKSNVQQTLENIVLDKASLHKITNTENGFPIISETLQFGNAIIHTAPVTSSNAENTRKLSLSPICSVSTQDAPKVNKSVVSKAITCKIYDSQKDLVPLGSISTPSDLSNEIQVSQALSTIIDLSGQNSSKGIRLKCRVPPEIRVAEYVQYIEKEILPLKMLLNDLICKCNALGLTFGKQTSKQSVIYQSVSSCSPEMTKSEEIAKSNRVVYSIVFDG